MSISISLCLFLVATAVAEARQGPLPDEAILQLGRECAKGSDESCQALTSSEAMLQEAFTLADMGPAVLVHRLAAKTVEHRHAITILRIGTNRFPREATFHYELAERILSNAHRVAPTYREAYGPLLRAVELKPDYVEALVELGHIEMIRKRPEVAVRHFQTALRIKPGLVEARVALADAWLRLKRPRESAEEYRAMLATPGLEASEVDWATTGWTEGLFWLGRGEEALSVLRQPIEGRTIASAYATCNLAITLRWLGHDDEARHECELALQGGAYCNCQGRVPGDATDSRIAIAQTADDDAVMRAALSNDADLGTDDDAAVIVEGTTAFSDVQMHPVIKLKYRFEWFAYQYDDESRVMEAVHDLLARSRVPVAVNLNVSRNGVSLIRTLDRDEMRQVVTGGTSFYQRFPRARGFVTVSRPGFSKDGLVAAIAVQRNVDLWDGPLLLFVLDRQDDDSWVPRHGADTGG